MRAPNGDDVGIALMLTIGLAPYVAALAFIVWLIRKATA